jgi:hypothetical protein
VSGCPERVVGGVGVDSMLRFRLERGGDKTKHCRKMKRRQQARLSSMERKRDTAQRCANVGQRRDGTGERRESRQHQLG